MRVAFVAETWLPSTDGVITRLLATCRELLAAGHEVLMVCPRPTTGDGDATVDARHPEGLRVRTVPTVGAGFLYGGQRWGLPVPAVSRYLREFGPDVVHVVNPMFLGVAGVAGARRNRTPLVASYHTNVAAYAGYYRLGWLRPLIRFVLRSLHQRASVNLATSGLGERELAAHGAANVRRWPRGVDVRLFRPSSRRVSRERPVALYVGRLAAEKGLERLRGLAAPDSGFDLVLVGDGPQREDIGGMLGPTTRVTGLLHGEDLAEAYREGDVFVFPSTTDTLGLVVLEAMASGLPVVAVESSASVELLGSSPATRLVPPDDPDALVRAAADLVAQRDADHDTAGGLARRFAEDCSWREATARLVDCYTQAIRQHHQDGATGRTRSSGRPAGLR